MKTGRQWVSVGLSVALSLGVAGCGKDRLTIGGSTQAQTAQPRPLPVVPGYSPTPPLLTGSLCTTWTEFTRGPQGQPALGISCLQADGTWLDRSGDIDAVGSPSGQAVTQVTYPTALFTSDGDLVVAYDREVGMPSPYDRETIVRRLRLSQGSPTAWETLGITTVNREMRDDGTGQLIETPMDVYYGQQGVELFEREGRINVLWSGSGRLTRSSVPIGDAGATTAWLHQTVFPATWSLHRYPKVLAYTPTDTMIYTGQPAGQITWWDALGGLKWIGGQPLPLDAGTSLHASLTAWPSAGPGALAYAWSSTDFRTDIPNMVPNVATIKVARIDLNTPMTPGGYENQTMLSNGIQDQSAPFAGDPFAFTIQNQLYVLYPDYQTTGQPQVNGEWFPQEVRNRYRVKRWNGSSWQRVGSIANESPTFFLSDRTQFRQENGVVYFSAVRPLGTTQSEQVVYRWSEALGFEQVGGVVRTFQRTPDPVYLPPSQSALDRLRSGDVFRLQ